VGSRPLDGGWVQPGAPYRIANVRTLLEPTTVGLAGPGRRRHSLVPPPSPSSSALADKPRAGDEVNAGGKTSSNNGGNNNNSNSTNGGGYEGMDREDLDMLAAEEGGKEAAALRLVGRCSLTSFDHGLTPRRFRCASTAEI